MSYTGSPKLGKAIRAQIPRLSKYWDKVQLHIVMNHYTACDSIKKIRYTVGPANIAFEIDPESLQMQYSHKDEVCIYEFHLPSASQIGITSEIMCVFDIFVEVEFVDLSDVHIIDGIDIEILDATIIAEYSEKANFSVRKIDPNNVTSSDLLMAMSQLNNTSKLFKQKNLGDVSGNNNDDDDFMNIVI